MRRFQERVCRCLPGQLKIGGFGRSDFQKTLTDLLLLLGQGGERVDGEEKLAGVFIVNAGQHRNREQPRKTRNTRKKEECVDRRLRTLRQKRLSVDA